MEPVAELSTAESTSSSWTFLTNHAHVLLAVAKVSDLRLREIAELVGITERTAMQIVIDLEMAGYVRRHRRGRRNHYTVVDDLHLRHPLEEHHSVARLLDALEHREPDRRDPVALAAHLPSDARTAS